MNHLIPLLSQQTHIFPLLGDQFKTVPLILDLSSSNRLSEKLDTEDFQNFQDGVFEELEQHGYEWAIGPYLEERRTLLRNYPQMIDEGRIYHLGVDVIVPGGAKLFAPLGGTVYKNGVESGQGNYGGYVILKHVVCDEVFYTFYGHLDSANIPEVGRQFKAGENFAIVASKPEDTGGWFTHTHLQLITEQGEQEGYFDRGYIDKENLARVDMLSPSPYLVFRY